MEFYVVSFLLGMLAVLVLRGRRPPVYHIMMTPYPEPVLRLRWAIRRRLLAVVCFIAILASLTFALWPTRTDVPQSLAGRAHPVGITPSPLPRTDNAILIRSVPTMLAAEPDVNVLNASGKALMMQGNYTQAEVRFQQAVELSPIFYEPYNNLAFCLYERGAIAAAINNWQTAIELYPDSPDANAGLGMALFVSGRTNEGLAHYQRAQAIDPRYADAIWMHNERLWSVRAVEDSRALR